MSKKYFIISDIHGFFDEMIRALNESGYDSDNIKHHLIVIGDLFDRGNQSNKVLEYLYKLNVSKKATIILGNHDNFLIEFLDKKYLKVLFNIKHNGTAKTITSLSGIEYSNEIELEEFRKVIIKKFPYLKSWLNTLPLYYEIGKYIFVHGGIDGNNLDWRKAPPREFYWTRQKELCAVKDKIMVVGHTRAASLRYPGANYKKLFSSNPEVFGILYEDNKIFIDSFVEISNFINVLVLEI